MSQRLDLQAEAIAKLVELVSNLEGVDAAPLKSYALRLQKVHPDSAAVPKVEGQSADQHLSAPEPGRPVE
jgi:hypothetical protein